MRILSLDQAPRNTGWARLSDDPAERPEWGCRDMPDYGDDEIPMLRSLREWLNKRIAEWRPDLVTFEQIVVNYRAINMPVLYQQFALVAGIQFVCMDLRIQCEMVEIYDWRARAGIPPQRPKGSSDKWLKEQSMKACFERGWLIDNEHAAEAMLMADYAMAMHNHIYAHRTGPASRRAISRLERTSA